MPHILYNHHVLNCFTNKSINYIKLKYNYLSKNANNKKIQKKKKKHNSLSRCSMLYHLSKKANKSICLTQLIEYLKFKKVRHLERKGGLRLDSVHYIVTKCRERGLTFRSKMKTI